MYTRYISATEFMLVESIFLEYGNIEKRQLAEMLELDIVSNHVKLLDHTSNRCWVFDFANRVAASPTKQIYWY